MCFNVFFILHKSKKIYKFVKLKDFTKVDKNMLIINEIHQFR